VSHKPRGVLKNPRCVAPPYITLDWGSGTGGFSKEDKQGPFACNTGIPGVHPRGPRFPIREPTGCPTHGFTKFPCGPWPTSCPTTVVPAPRCHRVPPSGHPAHRPTILKKLSTCPEFTSWANLPGFQIK